MRCWGGPPRQNFWTTARPISYFLFLVGRNRNRSKTPHFVYPAKSYFQMEIGNRDFYFLYPISEFVRVISAFYFLFPISVWNSPDATESLFPISYIRYSGRNGILYPISYFQTEIGCRDFYFLFPISVWIRVKSASYFLFPISIWNSPEC